MHVDTQTSIRCTNVLRFSVAATTVHTFLARKKKSADIDWKLKQRLRPWLLFFNVLTQDIKRLELASKYIEELKSM